MKLGVLCLPLFIAVSAFGGSSLEASSSTCPKQKKVYVEDSSIKVTSKGIVVTKGEYVFLVKAVRVDRKGLFILKKDLARSVAGEALRAKKVYRCSRCPRVFYSEQELYWHYLEKHSRHSDDDDD